MKQIVDLCQVVESAKEALDGPDMFERSKSAPAQAVNKAWTVLFSAMGDQASVYDALVALRSQCPPMIQLDTVDADSLHASLSKHKQEMITAKNRLGTLIALQSAFRPTTPEMPRDVLLLGLGRDKLSEIDGAVLPARLQTLLGDE